MKDKHILRLKIEEKEKRERKEYGKKDEDTINQ
jgi:hypothetical protein